MSNVDNNKAIEEVKVAENSAVNGTMTEAEENEAFGNMSMIHVMSDVMHDLKNEDPRNESIFEDDDEEEDNLPGVPECPICDNKLDRDIYACSECDWFDPNVYWECENCGTLSFLPSTESICPKCGGYTGIDD